MQRQWQITVHAKANTFSFKIKATKLACSFHRIALLLKLNCILLSLNATSHYSASPSRTTFKSKFLSFLRKIRKPTSFKKKASNPLVPRIRSLVDRLRQTGNEVTSLVRDVSSAGFLGLVSTWLSRTKILKAFLIYGSVLLLFVLEEICRLGYEVIE